MGTQRAIEPYYLFEFIGFYEYETMKYNAEILRLYANFSQKVRDNFDRIIGLENLYLVTLPDQSLGLAWNAPPEFLTNNYDD